MALRLSVRRNTAGCRRRSCIHATRTSVSCVVTGTSRSMPDAPINAAWLGARMLWR